MSNISTLYVSAYRPAILVAPLDWGLGHATRCIPLVRILESIGCEVIIGGNEVIQRIFSEEFPHLEFIHLPSYNIRYGHKNNFTGWKLLGQMPKILTIVKKEREIIAGLVPSRRLKGILSDNRFGCRHPEIPSVFITHQLSLQTPFGWIGNKLATFLNVSLVKKFQQVWVPDFKEAPGLAGKLSHPDDAPGVPVYYPGPLSRLKKQSLPKEYDLLLLLSGPEPQRSIFEHILREQVKQVGGKILLVRGLPQNSPSPVYEEDGIYITNYASSSSLATYLAQSEMVVCRSGYTTVMDLAAWGKKALLVPTPGQTEQEYLSSHLQACGRYYSATQQHLVLSEELRKASDFYEQHPVSGDEQEHQWSSLLSEWVATLPR